MMNRILPPILHNLLFHNLFHVQSKIVAQHERVDQNICDFFTDVSLFALSASSLLIHWKSSSSSAASMEIEMARSFGYGIASSFVHL
ncbi:hypothetical protein UF14_20155 [Bacillus licheniformis]|nr:hypothetical protein UF14_20155 [Bacillus licheniformis]MBG9694494.1 hypothetical protein [Bacillus licheniformis]